MDERVTQPVDPETTAAGVVAAAALGTGTAVAVGIYIPFAGSVKSGARWPWWTGASCAS